MKTTNCIWEQKNIGRKTVEILIEKDDSFDKSSISRLVQGYEYAVIKVPMNMPLFNIGLSRMGFDCIEIQQNMSMRYEDFDFSIVERIYNDTTYELVSHFDDFQEVLSLMEPGMFSTDRISIDPRFGDKIGFQRYVNWMTTEYYKGTSELIKVIYQDQHVGFMMLKFDSDEVQLLLNGLYKPFQRKGIGILTPASPLMYIRKNDIPIRIEKTSISSNNIPVVKLYNRLHFQISSQTYVFVKLS